MEADFHKITAWMESHPWGAGALVLGIGVALLWLFGAFRSGSSSSSNTSAGNSIASYYAAETAQTQASTALAITQSNNQTAVTTNQANDNAAVAINAANDQTSQINTRTYYNTQDKLGQYQLRATLAQTDAGLQEHLSDNSTMLGLNRQNTQASAYHDYLMNAFPSEIAAGYNVAHAGISLGPQGLQQIGVEAPPPPAAAAPAPAANPIARIFQNIWQPIAHFFQRPAQVAHEAPGQGGHEPGGGR